MTTLLLVPFQYHAINHCRTNLSLNMLDLHAFHAVESLMSARAAEPSVPELNKRVTVLLENILRWV